MATAFKQHNFRKFLQMITDKMANNYVAMPTNSTATRLLSHGLFLLFHINIHFYYSTVHNTNALVQYR